MPYYFKCRVDTTVSKYIHKYLYIRIAHLSTVY